MALGSRDDFEYLHGMRGLLVSTVVPNKILLNTILLRLTGSSPAQ
jgi:hypothetical protein